MTPNPCVLCGRRPIITPWAPSKGFVAYCYRDVRTHSLQCHGATIEEAIRRWNRLNPLRRHRLRWRVARRLFHSSEDITLGL